MEIGMPRANWHQCWRRCRYSVAILLPVLAMTSCSWFSPDYHKPKIALPNHWHGYASPVSAAVKLPIYPWWQQFHSKQLNKLVTQALQHNQKIQLAVANIQSAKSALTTVKLSWLPIVSIFAGYSKNHDKLTTPWQPVSLSGATSLLGILPQYTLNLFQNYARQKQAQQVVMAAKADYLAARLVIISQVCSSYITLIAQQQMLSLLGRLHLQLSEMHDIASQSYHTGLTAELPVNKVMNELTLLKGQIEQVKNNIALSQNALRSLVALPPGNIVLKTKMKQLRKKYAIPGNTPVSVIATRPDVMRAEAALRVANSGIKVASTSLLPSVSLNHLMIKTRNRVHGNRSDTSAHTTGAYGYVNVNPAAFGQIASSHVGFNAALIQYKATINDALHKIDNALTTYDAKEKKLKSNIKAKHYIDKNLALVRATYHQGIVSYSVLLGEKIRNTIMLLDINQIRLMRLIALVNVYQEFGAGSKYRNPIEIKK